VLGYLLRSFGTRGELRHNAAADAFYYRRALGIADYNSTLSAAFVRLGHLTETVRLPRLDPAGLGEACEVFRGRLSEFDLGLVQHERGFFGSALPAIGTVFDRAVKIIAR
jgi:hypothetical protein